VLVQSNRIETSSLPRRVLIATIFREIGGTGVHTHFHQFRGYLEQRGVKATVVTPFSWNRPLAYVVFSPRLALKYFSPSASVVWYRHWHEVFLHRALRRKLSEAGECIVYAQGPLEARAALRARRGSHQPVILAVHFRSSQADEHAEPGREIKRGGAVHRSIRELERKVILQVDGIIYVSEWARDRLLAWLPEAAEVRSAVFGNAVELLDVGNDREKLADLVTVGRLDTAKNHQFLLKVLAAAKQKGRDLTLDIYGDGPLRDTLARQAASLGLEGQVRILGFRRDVRQFLPRYRLYVHPSYSETSSLAIIEALGAGLPVLAGRIGGIPEIIEDGVEGRFWPVDDPDRATAVLLEFLDSGPLLEKAAIAARDRFERDFDINAVGAKMQSFLQESAVGVYLGSDAMNEPV
jgi:glycosyltransferase involved in cell wall biosynthesis